MSHSFQCTVKVGIITKPRAHGIYLIVTLRCYITAPDLITVILTPPTFRLVSLKNAVI
jgi:hypothetical protein